MDGTVRRTFDSTSVSLFPYRCAMVSRSRIAGKPMHRLGAALAVLAVAWAGPACADTDDGPLIAAAPAVTEAAPTTSTTSPAPRSEGTVEIDGTLYRFAVTCDAPGAGEVIVVGVGDDPVSGGLVELYLEALIGDPYIGLLFSDGTRVEPSLASALELYPQDDVIRASAVRFVRNLDLETGESEGEVGFGEVEIHCNSYEDEPPS